MSDEETPQEPITPPLPADAPGEMDCVACNGSGMSQPGEIDSPPCKSCKGRGTKSRVKAQPHLAPVVNLPMQVPAPVDFSQPYFNPQPIAPAATILIITGLDEQVQVLRQAGVPAGQIRVLTPNGDLIKVGP